MLNNSKHNLIMSKILKEIYTSEIGKFLSFKGGTMAMMFYGLDRFSIDLDFDLLDLDKKDEVYNKLKVILEKFGEIKESVIKSSTIFFLLSYGDRDHNIKVEVNTRDFGSKYEIQSHLGIAMKTMVKEDIFAHKLCAWYERYGTTNRDMYDVYFFYKKLWEPNESVIKDRTGMDYTEFLKLMLNKLETDPPRDILSGLGELLNDKQKSWVKNKLKDELIFELKLRLNNYEK